MEASIALPFDGQSTVPCFYSAEPPPPPIDLNAIPDNYLVPPSEMPGNDRHMLEMVNHLPPPPMRIACNSPPPGFVCGPLPASPGDIVKCVPRMDHSDLNQLSARVLPLSASRGNGPLDNPARADARFEFFPKKFLPALTRCCLVSGVPVLSAPSDIVPLPCGVSELVAKKELPAPALHAVDAFQLGFRKNPQQLHQLLITHQQMADASGKAADLAGARSAVWEHEAYKVNPGFLAQVKMLGLGGEAVLLFERGRIERELRRRKGFSDFLMLGHVSAPALGISELSQRLVPTIFP